MLASQASGASRTKGPSSLPATPPAQALLLTENVALTNGPLCCSSG